MIERIIKEENITIERYCEKIRNNTIRLDFVLQRATGVWKTSEKNELIHTTLMGGIDGYAHIPAIYLGKCENNDYVTDGGQRSAVIMGFKYGNYKITKTVDDPIIHYEKRQVDETGKYIKDFKGNYVTDVVEYDIRNKTYNDLPQELKDRFNDFSLRVNTYMDCTFEEMGKIIIKSNNHTSMNQTQRGFTYLSNFAFLVRNMIENNRFFYDCGKYTDNEKKKNGLDRVIMESVMTTLYLDYWDKKADKMAKFLNKNARKEDFELIDNYFERLITYTDTLENQNVAELFTTTHTHIWIALFNKFTKLGLKDSKFGEFLNAFVTELKDKTVNGFNWSEPKFSRNAKDKNVVIEKITYLETLMNEFFANDLENNDIEGANTDRTVDEDYIEFIRTNVNPDVTDEDLEIYEETLDDLLINVDNNTPLLEDANHKSLIGLVAWSYKEEIDLDDWIVDYFENNNTYDSSQAVNFAKMKASVIAFAA